ncbi:MAG TPA: hypothetical protein VI968_02660 [archaeon]|nr:hypothetical protein [archaeon]
MDVFKYVLVQYEERKNALDKRQKQMDGISYLTKAGELLNSKDVNAVLELERRKLPPIELTVGAEIRGDELKVVLPVRAAQNITDTEIAVLEHCQTMIGSNTQRGLHDSFVEVNMNHDAEKFLDALRQDSEPLRNAGVRLRWVVGYSTNGTARIAEVSYVQSAEVSAVKSARDPTKSMPELYMDHVTAYGSISPAEARKLSPNSSPDSVNTTLYIMKDRGVLIKTEDGRHVKGPKFDAYKPRRHKKGIVVSETHEVPKVSHHEKPPAEKPGANLKEKSPHAKEPDSKPPVPPKPIEKPAVPDIQPKALEKPARPTPASEALDSGYASKLAQRMINVLGERQLLTPEGASAILGYTRSIAAEVLDYLVLTGEATKEGLVYKPVSDVSPTTIKRVEDPLTSAKTLRIHNPERPPSTVKYELKPSDATYLELAACAGELTPAYVSQYRKGIPILEAADKIEFLKDAGLLSGTTPEHGKLSEAGLVALYGSNTPASKVRRKALRYLSGTDVKVGSLSSYGITPEMAAQYGKEGTIKIEGDKSNPQQCKASITPLGRKILGRI